MRKTIMNIIITLLILLITFFGLGPVVFADGTTSERAYTLLVVIALYLLMIAAFFIVNRRVKK
jgi:hydrogenase-4 membrane subunit HyfE